MKTRMFILAALAAPLLAWGAPISDIGDLIANPDDVMLRKPAKKAAAPKPAIDPALEAAAKADVDRRFAEAKARAEANARLAAEQEAAARKAKADAAKAAADRARAEAEKAAAEKAKAEAEARLALEREAVARKAKAEAEKAAADKAKAEADKAKAEAEKAAAEKARLAAEREAARKAQEAAEAKARQEAEMKSLREQVAAEKAAREKAERARAAAESKVEQAESKLEQAEAEKAAAERKAEKAEAAKASAEKRAAYLANPDPDERPAPKKKLQAAGDRPDVTEETSAAGGAGAAAKGKKKLTGRPAVITADRTDYDRKEGIILFDRNVYVDDEQYQMHADRMFVFLDGTNDLKRLVALGNVSLTNEMKSAGCQKAVYTKAASRIVMYGDEQNPAWLRDAGGRKGDDASEIAGLRITYWFDSETASVEKPVIKTRGMKGGPKDILGGPLGGKKAE